MKNSFGYEKAGLKIRGQKRCGKEIRRKIWINPQNESHIEKCRGMGDARRVCCRAPGRHSYGAFLKKASITIRRVGRDASISPFL